MTLEGIASIILALTAIVAAVMALRQLREMGNARQAEMLLWVYKELDRLREERRIIYNRLCDFNDDTFSSMPEDLRKAADNVAASINYLGQIVKDQLVRKIPILEMCLEVVINSWETMEPYVIYRRKQRGRYWLFFEDLYKECKNYQRRHKFDIKRYKDIEAG